MRVIEVNMERRWSWGGGGEAVDPREDPPRSGIFRHDSHLRKFAISENQGNSKLVFRMPECKSRLHHSATSLVNWVWSSSGIEGWAKREIPEKTRRLTASSCTIPTCKNLESYSDRAAEAVFIDFQPSGKGEGATPDTRGSVRLKIVLACSSRPTDDLVLKEFFGRRWDGTKFYVQECETGENVLICVIASTKEVRHGEECLSYSPRTTANGIQFSVEAEPSFSHVTCCRCPVGFIRVGEYDVPEQVLIKLGATRPESAALQRRLTSKPSLVNSRWLAGRTESRKITFARRQPCENVFGMSREWPSEQQVSKTIPARINHRLMMRKAVQCWGTETGVRSQRDRSTSSLLYGINTPQSQNAQEDRGEASSSCARSQNGVTSHRHVRPAFDKVDTQHVYTEVTFAIGSQFIRYTLDDPEPIPYLQGNKQRVPYCQVWSDVGYSLRQQPMNKHLRP
ncbi:hypothetical protein PR048_030791 [Dryococelus australis]|uniref:Uncharacterized protein n=1 Tax=Dryococelus australis TaxID=614101 RepID=A0ABQ9GDR9_9NEOP|nr:hypothetical protein PR048_030791 [Dryococelus australis]